MKKVFVILGLLISISGCKTLFSTISNKDVDTPSLIQAIKALDKINESPSLWTKIANNPSYSVDHRAIAIFQLFHRHFRAGMTLSEFADMLDRPVWLKDDQIEIVTTMAGWVPLDYESDETLADFGVCANGKKESAPVMFFRIHGKVDRETLSSFLRGVRRDERLKKMRVLQIASSEYHIKGYPVENAWGLNLETRRCIAVDRN